MIDHNMMSKFSLEGKTALVTGGCYGIGYGAVERRTVVDDVNHLVEDVLRKILVHLCAVEDVLSKVL